MCNDVELAGVFPDPDELMHEDDDNETYVLTPWGCLYTVLLDYGINAEHISGRVGSHIVEDFMDAMERSGYVAKADPDGEVVNA